MDNLLVADDPPPVVIEGEGLRAVLLRRGATLARLWAPDRAGRLANVTLGWPRLADYAAAPGHFGATTGRFANRIAGGRFVLEGTAHRLPRNDGPNCLHGGPEGFGAREWTIGRHGPAAAGFTLVSADGDQGFPGRLEVSVTYAIEAPATLRIAYRAEAAAPTVLNLTNHAYWNLAGEGSGGALDHELTVEADAFLPVDPALVPLPDAPAPVDGTPFDFRRPTPIGARIRDPHPQLRAGRGYDHCFALRGGATAEPRRAATLRDPASGRVMEVWTDQPGLQLYSGNWFDGSRPGASGRLYRQGDGVALETQHFPDSPNRPDFPSTLLRPGEVFRSVTLLRFGAG
ncbi:MAG: galactose mutarotase [Acetobacteraceae bacterium]|nr:galactose mutarotase [Acetobacteraceae bacterium]